MFSLFPSSILHVKLQLHQFKWLCECTWVYGNVCAYVCEAASLAWLIKTYSNLIKTTFYNIICSTTFVHLYILHVHATFKHFTTFYLISSSGTIICFILCQVHFMHVDWMSNTCMHCNFVDPVRSKHVIVIADNCYFHMTYFGFTAKKNIHALYRNSKILYSAHIYK